MKAVIYARYSSDNQREESIEGQIRECTAFAEKNGITILRHYIDRAFSAKTDNRPEFQNMIKDSGKRLFDMIIVWKLDRFARNRYDSARYKTALKKNGVKVVSATEVISDGAEGIILESVLEGYAEYYSADLSEKVVRGMTENALKSKYNGGTRPIGYLIDSDQHFQLDPLTAPFVREAFQRYDEGATMTAIRDWLNEQGVKNTRGQKMTYNSVQHLLNNRRYIGEYTYRDIVVPDGIPAIVPQDLFDRVQQKLSKNKKAPARHKAEDDYLLTIKLFCGYCGAYLCGESGTSHTGNVHHYYKCVSVKKKRTECHKKSVRKEWIEDLVVSETMKMVMDDEAIEAIVSMLMDLQDRENVNLPLYEQQLREADTAIQNLLNAIQQGILTKSTKSRLEELEATKEELETKIACEKLAKPKVSAEFMTFWLQRFRKLDVRQKSHRKMLIDTFINAIFLYDDKMVITFNYKEGATTITFDDLKTALADQKTGSDLDCSTAPGQRPANPVFSMVCGPFHFLFFPDGKAVVHMLEGLQRPAGPVDHIPLDVLRRQQRPNAEAVLLEKRFQRRAGKHRTHGLAAGSGHQDRILHPPLSGGKEALVGIVKHQRASRRAKAGERRQRLLHGLRREIIGHAQPGEKGSGGRVEAGGAQALCKAVPGEIHRNEGEPLRALPAGPVDPGELVCLRQRMIHLKHPALRQKRRLPEGEGIQPCAEDDILPCARLGGGLQRLLRIGRPAQRRRGQLRIHQPAQQRLWLLSRRVCLRLKKLRALQNIALHGGIFLRRHQLPCKPIPKHGMGLVFRMKRPPKGAHQGGDAALILHKPYSCTFLLFFLGTGVIRTRTSMTARVSCRFSISRTKCALAPS